jgi:hypothetical protein
MITNSRSVANFHCQTTTSVRRPASTIANKVRSMPSSYSNNVAAPTPEAVSVPVFCQMFGLGRSRAYELINSGVLPSIKIGKRRLVRLETARRVLASFECAEPVKRATSAGE